MRPKKQLAAPKDNSDKIAALPDISGVVSDDDAEPKKDAKQKREEVKEDMHKSQEEMHDEIISKAKENAKKACNCKCSQNSRRYATSRKKGTLVAKNF